MPESIRVFDNDNSMKVPNKHCNLKLKCLVGSWICINKVPHFYVSLPSYSAVPAFWTGSWNHHIGSHRWLKRKTKLNIKISKNNNVISRQICFSSCGNLYGLLTLKVNQCDLCLCYSVFLITGIFEKEYGKCVSSEIFDVVLILSGMGLVFS